MTFREAYIMAWKKSDIFRKNVKEIHKRAEDNDGFGVCQLFSIGSESFWYGWDGCEINKGKHNSLTAHRLIKTGQTLVIE